MSEQCEADARKSGQPLQGMNSVLCTGDSVTPYIVPYVAWPYLHGGKKGGKEGDREAGREDGRDGEKKGGR